MPAQTAADSTPSALDYLRAINRRKWWVAALALIVAAAGLGYSVAEKKTYSSTAEILVESSSVSSALAGNSSGPITPADVNSQEQILGGSAIRAAVKRQIGTFGAVSFGTIANSNLITVTAASSKPRTAQYVANKFADTYVRYRTTQVAQATSAAVAQLQGRLTGLLTLAGSIEKQLNSYPANSTSPAAQALQSELQDTLTNEGQISGEITDLKLNSVANPGAKLVSPAVKPTSPTSPKTSRNVAAGFGIGLILGILLALLIDNFDDRIRSREELEEQVSRPVLGMVPSVRQWRRGEGATIGSVSNSQSPVIESYRALRTALQFALLDKEVKTILVASSMMAEGKTVTAANLGAAIARAGNEVLVVSADLRRPRLAEFLGLDETIGLSSVILGTSSLNDAIRAVPGNRGLYMLGTGPVSPDPAEFLASKPVVAVMEEAAARYDYVIVDSAPLLPVADGLAVTGWCDAVVLVTRFEVTRRRYLRRAVEMLENANVPVCGVVLNDVMVEGGRYRGYGYYGYGGYGYGGYGYGGDSNPQHRARGRKERGRRRDREAVAVPTNESLSESASAFVLPAGAD